MEQSCAPKTVIGVTCCSGVSVARNNLYSYLEGNHNSRAAITHSSGYCFYISLLYLKVLTAVVFVFYFLYFLLSDDVIHGEYIACHREMVSELESGRGPI